MYRVESSGALLRAHRALASRRIQPRVSRTVVLLGICSLLTDISSEMVVRRPAAVPGRPSSAHAAAVRRHRRPVPGRRRVRAPRRRLPRRSPPPAQGGRLDRVRPVRRLQARAGGGRDRVRRDQRDRDDRPLRQGHAHRAARRDDLAHLAGGGPRHVVRRAPRARHRRRAARPAARVRPARAGAAGVRRAVPRLVLLRRRRPRRARPARARAGAQGGRRRRAARPAARRRSPCCTRPRFRALFIAAAVLGLATASDGFIYLSLQRRSTSTPRCSRCCSPAPP